MATSHVAICPLKPSRYSGTEPSSVPDASVTVRLIDRLPHGFKKLRAGSQCCDLSVRTEAIKPKFPPWTLGTGLILVVLSIGVVLLASGNFIAIGLAWFFFLIGIALVMMGALERSEQQQKKEPAQYREITREIVKVRCSHWGGLNFETSNRCSNCGANL